MTFMASLLLRCLWRTAQLRENHRQDSEAQTMAIRGMILDVEGTLVLSNDAHAHAWVEAFKGHGRDVPYDEVRRLIGMGGDKLMPRVAPGLSTDEGIGKEISETRKRIFLERYAPHLKPAPGARALVEHMKACGLQIAIATSAKEDELHTLLKIAGVDDLVETKTSKDDVRESKPAPDAVEKAAKKLGLPPEETLMLGDTPYDIESAGKAGVGTIAVRCGGWDDAGLHGALAIYDDPADLLAHYDESPLADQPRRVK
jgi:HAD superfamily hydrolase (TIGR01509 family)